MTTATQPNGNGQLKIVEDATCTFCGCVCDDIELHVEDDHRITQAKRACVLGKAWFLNHEVEDRPIYGDIGHGPWCIGLPFPEVPIRGYVTNDGDDRSVDKTNPLNILTGAARTSMGFSGTEADAQVIRAILAAKTGKSVDSYDSIATLLYGPLLRGRQVGE